MDKKFEKIRMNHFIDKDIYTKIFDIVKNFIIKKELILAGGMAIDFAMRLKGTKLYSEDTIPDYDFYTPNHINDTKELGIELCNNGITNIDAVVAIHISTIRLRFNKTSIADLTFVPQKIFEKMKFLQYQSFKILHPWYIIMDQFSALTKPYDDPPRENITGRWKKDIPRLEKLLELYPFEKSSLTDDYKIKQLMPISKMSISPIILNTLENNIVINGWLALAYYNHYAKIANLSSLDFQKNDKDVIFIVPKEAGPFTIMTTKIFSIMNLFPKKKIKYYHHLKDFPRYLSLLTDEPEPTVYNIYDTDESKLVVLPEDEKFSSNIKVIGLAGLAWYFIKECIFGTITQTPKEKEYALLGLELVFELMKSDNWKLTSLPIYGENTLNPTYVENLKVFLNADLRFRLKPSAFAIKQEELKCYVQTESEEFKPSESIFFRFDGSPAPRFEPLIETDILDIQFKPKLPKSEPLISETPVSEILVSKPSVIEQKNKEVDKDNTEGDDNSDED